MRPVPHSEELPLSKPLEILIFNDNNSDSDKDRRQQKGTLLIAIQHLKQVVPHLNSI